MVSIDSNVRRFYSAKFPAGQNPVVDSVNRHSGLIANLNTDHSVHLEVSNYAVGGFFDTHVDYLRGINPMHEMTG